MRTSTREPATADKHAWSCVSPRFTVRIGDFQGVLLREALTTDGASLGSPHSILANESPVRNAQRACCKEALTWIKCEPNFTPVRCTGSVRCACREDKAVRPAAGRSGTTLTVGALHIVIVIQLVACPPSPRIAGDTK